MVEVERPRRDWVTLCLRLALGTLFTYAGAAKLVDIEGLAVDIANYRLLPGLLVAPLAVTLPGIELLCGTLLLMGRWMRAAAVLVAAMLATFSGAVGQALARGISLECGCFGAARDPVTAVTLARDLGLFALAVVLAVRARD